MRTNRERAQRRVNAILQRLTDRAGADGFVWLSMTCGRPSRQHGRFQSRAVNMRRTRAVLCVGRLCGKVRKMCKHCEKWCCQTGLNCRPLHYQWSALPLSYGSMLVAGIGSGSGPPSEAFSATPEPRVQARWTLLQHHCEGFIRRRRGSRQFRCRFLLQGACEGLSFACGAGARTTPNTSTPPSGSHGRSSPDPQ